MEDTILNKIISELNSELNSKYTDFKGIYLFGSRARGDWHKDSDYDFAFIFDRKINNKLKDEISSIVLNYMIKYDIIVDNLVYNISDIINPITPIRENIKIEGVFYG